MIEARATIKQCQYINHLCAYLQYDDYENATPSTLTKREASILITELEKDYNERDAMDAAYGFGQD